MALAKSSIAIHPMGFCPDLPSWQVSPGIPVVDANNMYPTPSGIRMMPSLVRQVPPAPDTVLEAFSGRGTQGATGTFAGTATNLYMLLISGGAYSWVEVDGSQSYNADHWSFAQAGDDTLATNGGDPVQVYAGSEFAALGGDPPLAKFVTVVDPGAGTGYVVVLANLETDQTGWVASGPGSDTVWTLNVNDLSASGFLRSAAGPITALATLRTYAVAFKDRAVYLGQFVGPPFVWAWSPVSHQVGTLANDSVINTGDLLCFVGPDDFYQFDGSNLSPIPNALAKWFFGTTGVTGTGYADPHYFTRIQGRYDAPNSTLYWHFASVHADPRGTLDTWISWNRRVGRWLVGHLSIEAVLQTGYSGGGFTEGGYTYDQFTSIYQQYANLPHLRYNSAVFSPQSAATVAAGLILPDHALWTYSGNPTTGYVQLGDLGTPGRLTQINNLFAQFGIYPTGNATVDVFSRINVGAVTGPAGWAIRKTGIPLGYRGEYNFRVTDYWQSYKFSFTTDAELQSILVDGRDAGAR